MVHVASLLVALAVSQSLPPWMSEQSRSEDLSISLVTFSPGDELYSWWGHTALVVEDKRLNHGRLYNFGMFGAADEVAFVKMFAQGRLWFWVADDPIGWTYEMYRRMNRDVRIQELDLTPDEAMNVAKALGSHVLPENRSYLYHHYDDNCSTRPRDILDRAIGGQLVAATSGPGRMSIRQHAARYAEVNPPMSLLLDFLQNDTLDGPTTEKREAFLPDELERQVQALQVKHADGTTRPLVKRQYDWFKAKRAAVPEKAASLWPVVFAVGAALGGLSFWLLRRAQAGAKAARLLLGLSIAAWGMVFGILGTGLFEMALFTNHEVTFHNENLLFVNPVTLMLVPAGIQLARNRPAALARLRWLWTFFTAGAALDIVCKVLPWFDQDNWNVLALFVPVHLALAAAFTVAVRAQVTSAAAANAAPVPQRG